MALGALLAWEVRTGGSDNNGGAWNVGASGTDRSQQNSAQVAIDNSAIMTSVTSNVVTFVSGYTPSAADVGNVVNSLTGTNVVTGPAVISSINVGALTWTLDHAPVSSGVMVNWTANMGGALASPGAFGLYHIAGHDCWIGGGTYTLGTGNSNLATGCVTLAGGSSAANCQRLEGYNASRGDKGTFPIIKASVGLSSFVIMTLANGATVEGIECDGNSRTSSKAFSGLGNSLIFRCRGRNCTNSAMTQSGAGKCSLFEATGCLANTAVIVSGSADNITAHGNTITGVSFANSTVGFNILSVNNTGASSDGILTIAARINGFSCYGNGRDGIRATAGTTLDHWTNGICETNVGTGYNASAAADGVVMVNCAYYNNGTNVSTNITAANNFGGILGTSSFFVNAAGNNFALNSTAGAGASCRAAGIPTASGTYALPGLSTASYPDIGASQHSDTTVGGARSDFMAIGVR